MKRVRKRWYGVYPGTVVLDDEPNKGGRLRVRVDQVYGAATEPEFIADAQLPWARPCFPMDDVGTPPVGANVWVMFWAGDPERPVWLGRWYPTASVPGAFSGSYGPGPQTRLIQAGGHVIELRSAKGQVHVQVRTKGGQVLDLIDDAQLGGPKIRIESPGGTIELVGAHVAVGDSGAKFRLLDERFLTQFNAHTHPTPSGISGVPSTPVLITGNGTTILMAD